MPEKGLWEHCLNEKIIVKMTPNLDQSRGVMHLAMLRIEFWYKNIDAKFPKFPKN